MNWDIAITAVSVMITLILLFLFRRLAGDRLQELQSNWIVRLIAIAVIGLLLWLTLSRLD